MSETFDQIDQQLVAVKAKLDRMPTTRECIAFTLGFAMCGAFVIALMWLVPLVVGA